MNRHFRAIQMKGGFTLAEMVIALGVTSSMFLALAYSFVSLEDNAVNTDNFSQYIDDQQRMIDYISRDIRRATNVTVSGSGSTLVLTQPDQYVASGTASAAYDAQGNPIGTLATPSLTSGTNNTNFYGTTANALTVTYYLSGNNLMREQVVPAMSGTTYLVVATGVSSFVLDFTPQTTVVNYTICYQSHLNASFTSAATATSTTVSAATALRDTLAY